jgi:hypothetical protein
MVVGRPRRDGVSVRASEMLEHGKGILRRHGWEKDAVKEERYFIPTPVHA